MATALVSAAFSVVGKALAPLTDGFFKNWAASVKLGDNVKALELELLSTLAVLEHTSGKEIADNSAFRALLVRLQELGYDADDVLDELDYFRIQDQLDNTSAAADTHAKGCTHNLILNAKAVGKQIICLPTCLSPGKCFPCSSSMPCVRDDNNCDDNRRLDNSPQINHRNDEPPKLRFNRVDASKKMQHIVEQLRLVKQEVSRTMESRIITTSEPIDFKLYGRDLMMSSIIHDITEGKHSGNLLTVIPIVGPGGIGKTTLAQHIYHNEKVQQHFEVKVWKCVSLKSNANNLIEEIEKHIPQVRGENSTSTAGELVGQRLKDKRFLLVLDDIWDCREPGWEQLLVPFKKSQVQGNIIIVTTRLPAQAQIMIQNIDCPMALQGLEHDEFMKLFLAIIFGNDQPGATHKFFIEIADAIASKLKGSPLAARTVGRLLKTQLDRGHWTRVLESQDVLRLSPSENKRVEDIGLSNLRELVNYGTFEKACEEENGSIHYILHDLLHKLARKVSSHECLSIDSSEFKVSSLNVLPSIRHLSINIDDTSVKDRLTLQNCVADFNTLDKRLKVKKLRTLMLFGRHYSCLVKVFGDLFRESEALRVIFLSHPYYDVKDVLHNFNSLVHLSYLRIQYPYFLHQEINPLPIKLSRFYHMMVLDVGNYHISVTDISNLVKLRHVLVPNCSSIVEVGKLKSLQELRIFKVKQECQGFELRQIGELVELSGSLSIDGLENVQVAEADEAKLTQKGRLRELRLCWQSTTQNDSATAIQEHVLEWLKPSSNLQNSSISGNRGDTCPSWLGTSLSVENLESLFLDGVAWKTFPPIGELFLVNVSGEEIPSIMPEKRFENLRELVLEELPQLKRWVVHAPCQWFPFLEQLDIIYCSNLVELSFSHSFCCRQEKLANGNLFPNKLLSLKIMACPQLSSLPTALPWTNESTCHIDIQQIGSSSLHSLSADADTETGLEYSLTIEGKDTQDSMLWNALAFHNLTELKSLIMTRCQPPSLCHLQMLSSLRTLCMSCNAFPFIEGDSHFKYQLPVEQLQIDRWSASGKKLTQLLTCFPKLSNLSLYYFMTITGLGVMGQHATAAPGPSSSANKLEEKQRQQQQGLVALEEGLLLLPPQLQLLKICGCPQLSLHSNPYLDSNGRTGGGGGGGLQGMISLPQLSIFGCPNFLSLYSSSSFSSGFPFPNSLEDLSLDAMDIMETLTLVPLLNLCSSLTRLSIGGYGNLRGEGLLSLLSQGHLTELFVRRTPNFFVDWEHELPSCSSKLQSLSTDDVAGVTSAPICRFLVSSLTKLWFGDKVVDRFTEEQETLLFVNSLEQITFHSCNNLQYLPARLHRLPNLKILDIYDCKAIQMLPKDSLPSSLQQLKIWGCPELRSLPEGGLPSSLQQLCIKYCPAIQLLPKVDDLPSSLQLLDVRYGGSDELTRQCRGLIGIIPIVIT
ncbi:hypothetical protein HU200_061055 [Digitaria exilis]|uniref:AAA+ ATPase domain-containing protein n=1 Tax=Digitaria exilis TaxID=1010633 RepID=A0A835A544_9POAL|nr:hypothetical protein HU200_061055 [Digitaria exilis]